MSWDTLPKENLEYFLEKLKGKIPTKTSDLTNDSEFITEEDTEVVSVLDTTPYLYRESPAIGTRVMENALVGASVVKNQLIKNGNFVDTSNWGVYNATLSVSNNVIELSVTGRYPNISQSVSLVNGHRYLITFTAKGDRSTTNILFNNAQSVISEREKLVGTEFTTFFSLVTATATGSYPLRFIDSDSNSASGNKVYFKNIMFIDITQELGVEIADYARSKELIEIGSGAKWLESQGFDFSKYIAYNTGTLESVEVTGKEVVGFNQWDEEWEVGRIERDGHIDSTGVGANLRRTTSPIKVQPNTTYYQACPDSAMHGRSAYYDASGNLLEYYADGFDSHAFTTPQNADILRITIKGDYGTTYNHDICINISKTEGTPKNGDYVPYEKHTYAYPETTLRGLFELVNDRIVADGDRLESNGTHEVVRGRVDLGDLNWSYYQSVFYTNLDDKIATLPGVDEIRLICNKYMATPRHSSMSPDDDKVIYEYTGGSAPYKRICIRDDYFNGNTTSFKQAMSDQNVKLEYELATPTTEQLAPFDNPQISIVGGTEKYITETDVPVGHESEYKDLPALFDDDYIQAVQERAENAIQNGWHDSVENLIDTDIDEPSDGQVMQFDASSGKWGNETLVIPSKTSDLVNDDGFITEANVDVKTVFDSKPYLYRQTPLVADAIYDELVGASVVRNQLFMADSGLGTSAGTTITENADGSYHIVADGTPTGSHYIYAPDPTFAKHKYLVTTKGMKTGITAQLYAAGTGVDSIYYFNAGTDRVRIINVNPGEGYDRLRMRFRAEATFSGSTDLFYYGIDLTQWFANDPSIADTAYAKEQAELGSGIQWLLDNGHDFSKYIPYNTGTLESVEVTGKEVVGFNQWDEEWALGAYDSTGGINTSVTNVFRSTNKIKIDSSLQYYFKNASSNQQVRIVYWDANDIFISSEIYNANAVLTIPQNARYMAFNITTTYGSNTYKNDICINISKTTGTPKNGDYVPYEKHTYPIPETTLRGLFKLVNDNIVANGDRLESDGTHKVVRGRVDLGDLSWTYSTTLGDKPVFTTTISSAKSFVNGDKILCVYPQAATSSSSNSSAISAMSDKQCQIKYSSTQIYIADSTYTDAATFKTAMSGVYLEYPLATPTTEQLAPFTSPAEMNNIYTEEWITKNDVPVGHESTYKQLPEWTDDEYAQHVLFNKADTDITSYYESKPYLYRRSVAIGDRVYDNKLIGASVVVNQLVQNGDFASTSGWSVQNSGTITVSDNVATVTFTSNGQSDQLVRPITMINGHTYLSMVQIKQSTAHSGIQLYGGFQTHIATSKATTEWQTLFAITKATTYDYWILRNNTTQTNYTIQVKKAFVVDLTQMFGTQIADKMYSLGSKSGLSWIQSYQFLTKDYYPHNPGQLISVMPTGKKYVGKNQINTDGVTFISGYRDDNGNLVASSNSKHTAQFYNVLPKETYTISGNIYVVGYPFRLYYLTSDKSWISRTGMIETIPYTFVTPDNCYYIQIQIGVGLSLDTTQLEFGTTSTPYEPYVEQFYDISADEIRGILKLVGDEIVLDGDVREANGNCDRKYDEVDLGDLDWAKATDSGEYFKATISDSTITVSRLNFICSPYLRVSFTDFYTNRIDKTCSGYIDGVFLIRDSAYSSGDATAFKTAMSGKKLVYEIATPTTEQLTPFDSPQICYKDGTEEFIDERDVPVPVGHESEYIKVPDWMAEEHVKGFRDRVYSAIENVSVEPPTLHAYNSTTHKMSTNGDTPLTWNVEDMPSQMKDFYQKFEAAINDHGTQLADIPADWTFIKSVTSTSGESVTIPNTANYIMVLLFGAYSPDPLLPPTYAVCNSLEAHYGVISMSHYDVELHGTYHNVDHYIKYDDESHKWSVSDANTSASIFYR